MYNYKLTCMASGVELDDIRMRTGMDGCGMDGCGRRGDDGLVENDARSESLFHWL